MNKPRRNICVVLPSPIGYSETFLQAHVDSLSTAVNYLHNFPIDIDDVFQKQRYSKWTEQRVHTVRICWHRYVVNPLKKISVRNFLREKDIHVVLAEYGMTAIGAAAVCKELSIPLVVHFHGYDAYITELLDRHKRAYARVFDIASAIVVVSKHMKEQLITMGAPAEKVYYNPYGVDIAKFKQTPLAASLPKAISVGRLVEKKAPYLTLLAFKKVLEKLPEARLVIVGTGPLHDICLKLMKSLHIGYAVEFTGALRHDEVARLMQQSRVFVQHSVMAGSGDSEGTPVAILEAGAAGLPVVSTRHAGISDVVVHGKTGFLVDEGDIDGMSEYLYTLLADPILAAELGQNAREHVTARFTMERSISELTKILENCVIRASGSHQQKLQSSTSIAAASQSGS